MVRVGQARAGVILEGRVVMSLRQCRAIGTLHGSSLHCEASILTAAEKEKQERREGEGKDAVTQSRCGGFHISLYLIAPLNLFVCFTLTRFLHFNHFLASSRVSCKLL